LYQPCINQRGVTIKAIHWEGFGTQKGAGKVFLMGDRRYFYGAIYQQKNEFFWPSESTNTFLEHQKNQGNIKKARGNNKTPHKV